MIADNYWKTNEILRRLIDAEPSRRREILETSDISPEVRAEVESLLALESEVDGFLSVSVTDFSKDFVNNSDEPETFAEGLKISSYEIIGELGSGGMGAVYLVRRADGKFEQKVAVKMLRREFNVERIRRYFQRESEIQAKLEHPNIARLLDVGKTDDGVPFIVMEYVEGVRVDRFCEENNLSVKDRLKLFNKICQAVAHAHRNLIIHRDLKPSNILINQAGEPKLLDFGISKLLDENNSSEKTALTALGAMTPEYASPEQIRGESVSTATDIYSLGVILYKMLTGNLPYDLKAKTNAEIFKTVSESEPQKPSARQSSKTDNPKLNSDLDNIILKSLRKEPERRYKTVGEFADDIWRYLDGLPVSARPSTISYRAGKFLRRNKISVIAAVLILTSLIGGVIVSLQQAKTARAAQINAEQQFLLAKREEEKAKKISDFMSKIIAYGNPHWSSPGYKYKGETKVTEALRELDDRIDIEFAGQPDVQADLHFRFANAYYFHVGDDFIQRKRFHFDRALELRKQIYGDYHENVAEVLFAKWASLRTDDPQQAEILMEAIEMLRATNPNSSNLPFMYEGYTNRLTGAFSEIKFEESHAHQIEKNVRVLSKEELSDMYRRAVRPPTAENNFQIAERMLRESLPILHRSYKPDDYPIIAFECYLSYNLAKQSKWTDFDEHFRVCRQSEKVPENSLEVYRKRVEIIEKLASEGKN